MRKTEGAPRGNTPCFLEGRRGAERGSFVRCPIMTRTSSKRSPPPPLPFLSFKTYTGLEWKANKNAPPSYDEGARGGGRGGIFIIYLCKSSSVTISVFLYLVPPFLPGVYLLRPPSWEEFISSPPPSSLLGGGRSLSPPPASLSPSPGGKGGGGWGG